ncbi:MAG: O-antigen ligase family protein [Clostridia bacterium]|nr:O-antigen ligase family protein [Clostridia bacterium]
MYDKVFTGMCEEQKAEINLSDLAGQGMNNTLNRFHLMLLRIFVVLYMGLIYLVPNLFPDKIKFIILAVVAVILFFTFVFIRDLFCEKYFFGGNILFFILLYIQEIVMSVVTYRQSFIDTVTEGKYYLLMLSYFIMACYLKKDGNYHKLYGMIVVFSAVLSVFYIVYYLFLSYFDLQILPLGYDERFGGYRVTAFAYIINSGTLLALGVYLNPGFKLRYRAACLFVFAAGLFELIVVQKTRAALVMELVCILCMIVFAFRKRIGNLIITGIVAAVIVAALVNTPLFKSYMDSVSNEDTSVSVRLEEVDFYLSQVKESPLYGMGFIKNMEDRETYALLRGQDKMFYREDVGIVGFVNTFGVLGLLWYLWLVIKLSAGLILSFRLQKGNSLTGLIGVAVLIILSSATLIITDSSRIAIFPVILALIDSVYAKSSMKEQAEHIIYP